MDIQIVTEAFKHHATRSNKNIPVLSEYCKNVKGLNKTHIVSGGAHLPRFAIFVTFLTNSTKNANCAKTQLIKAFQEGK